PRPSRAPLVAPARGAGQPCRAARGDLADPAAAADRLGRRLPGDPHPAVPRGHRELRVVELADDPGGLLRDPRLLPALGGGWRLLLLVVVAGLLVLSWRPLRNLFSPHQLMNASFNRFHLVNAYGAFGSMTERRFEVVIEGTLDPDPDTADDAAWHPFEFRGKPGDVRRRSRQFAPYHLRLDWQM